MGVSVPVGPFSYEIRLERGMIPHPDGDALGTCDTIAQVIRVSDRVPPAKRMSLFWHELAHAIKGECDIHAAVTLDEEPIANMLGLGLAGLTSRALACVEIYLKHGIEAVDVMTFPGCHWAIPVISLSRGASDD